MIFMYIDNVVVDFTPLFKRDKGQGYSGYAHKSPYTMEPFFLRELIYYVD